MIVCDLSMFNLLQKLFADIQLIENIGKSGAFKAQIRPFYLANTGGFVCQIKQQYCSFINGHRNMAKFMELLMVRRKYWSFPIWKWLMKCL